MIENQQLVSAWARETFGERDAEYRALMVLEEAMELCAACGVSPARMFSYFDHVLAKISAQRSAVGQSEPAEEAADTLATLYALASTMEFDVHDALDSKMRVNRLRPKSYYDYKSAQKAASLGESS